MKNYSYKYEKKMWLKMRLGNFVKAVLRLEICLLQSKGLGSDSDIIFPSTLLKLGLGNESEARPSVTITQFSSIFHLQNCLTENWHRLGMF